MFDGLLQIFSGAPKWVWLVFAYLVFVGVRFLQDRIVFLPALLIVPVIFTAIKASGCPLSLAKNFAIIALFTLLSWAYNFRIKVEPVGPYLWATIPGTPMYLLIFILIFATRFGFGVLQTTNPILYGQYAAIENYLTAVYTGALWGRVLAIFQNYFI